MRLVDDRQEIPGEIIEEGVGRLAGLPPAEIEGVILDPRAIPEFPEHVQVEEGPFLETFRLDDPSAGPKIVHPLFQLLFDAVDRGLEDVPGGGEKGPGVDDDLGKFLPLAAEKGVDRGDPADGVPVQLDAVGEIGVGRKDVDDVAPNPEPAAFEIILLALVLDVDEGLDDPLPRPALAGGQGKAHGVVRFRGADSIDAGDRGDDDHVPALEEAVGRVQAHPVDFVVDRDFLGDIRVGGGEVGLGLVVIVIGNEVFDGVAREEAAELLEELGGQGLIVGDHEDRAVGPGDDVGHRERLSRSRHAHQDLVEKPPVESFREVFDRPDLVALGIEIGDELEGVHDG